VSLKLEWNLTRAMMQPGAIWFASKLHDLGGEVVAPNVVRYRDWIAEEGIDGALAELATGEVVAQKGM
jgi:hypothetical protein